MRGLVLPNSLAVADEALTRWGGAEEAGSATVPKTGTRELAARSLAEGKETRTVWVRQHEGGPASCPARSGFGVAWSWHRECEVSDLALSCPTPAHKWRACCTLSDTSPTTRRPANVRQVVRDIFFTGNPSSSLWDTPNRPQRNSSSKDFSRLPAHAQTPPRSSSRVAQYSGRSIRAVATGSPSKPNEPQSERVRDDADRAGGHRGGCKDRTQKDTEKRVQEPRSDGYSRHVVDEREEEVLANVAHGGLGEPASADDSGQITLQQRHPSAASAAKA